MTYTIMIDEDQRIALQTLINNNLHLTDFDQPLEFWPEMLNELPELEKEDPNTIHGFCL